MIAPDAQTSVDVVRRVSYLVQTGGYDNIAHLCDRYIEHHLALSVVLV